MLVYTANVCVCVCVCVCVRAHAHSDISIMNKSLHSKSFTGESVTYNFSPLSVRVAVKIKMSILSGLYVYLSPTYAPWQLPQSTAWLVYIYNVLWFMPQIQCIYTSHPVVIYLGVQNALDYLIKCKM